MATVAALAVSLLLAIQAPAAPSFDVASIRESRSVEIDGFFNTSGRRFTVSNLSLKSIIRYAYRVRDYQLLDVPGWADNTIYNIEATLPADAGEDTDVRPMLQTLLAERFGLRVRREQRELPAYALVAARRDGTLGPGLTRSTTDCAQGAQDCRGLQSRARIRAFGNTMAQLAGILEPSVERPVVDRTGLDGRFDFDVRWAVMPNGNQGSVAVGAEDLGSMLTALREQLGLRLESTRAPYDVVIVETVQRPSPN